MFIDKLISYPTCFVTHSYDVGIIGKAIIYYPLLIALEIIVMSQPLKLFLKECAKVLLGVV